MLNSTRISSYIPLDKSWMMRMGFLDAKVTNKQFCINNILRHEQKEMCGTDIQNLKGVLYGLKTANVDKPLYVGESATLYRFLTFFLKANGLGEREIVKTGSLLNREMSDIDKIFTKPQKELLKLDGGTSGWASASALFLNGNRVLNPPYKLALTYEAIDTWKQSKWFPRLDETLFLQAYDFLEGKSRWTPKHSEDFCYAYAFDYMTLDEAKEKWPQLANHESNRFEEMQRQIKEVDEHKKITSTDHRVVQAATMYAMRKYDLGSEALEMDQASLFATHKTWPLFMKFMNDALREKPWKH